MLNKKKIIIVISALIVISGLIYVSYGKISFEKLDHFTQVTDNESKEEVYLVANYPEDIKEFSREITKFLKIKEFGKYKARVYVFIKEHEKIVVPLVNDTLNYNDKLTKKDEIKRYDHLATGINYLNEKNELVKKISLGNYFSNK
jgi:hypothetical protein